MGIRAGTKTETGTVMETEQKRERWSRREKNGKTGTGVETKGRTSDGDEDGSGDGNKRSSGHGNGSGSGSGSGNGSGNRNGIKDGKGNENQGGGGEGGEIFGIHHTRKKAEYNTRYGHFARGIISVNRRWRLPVARSFRRKTRHLLDSVVPRREKGIRDGKEKMVKGTRTGAGMKARACTGTSTKKARMEARTEGGTGTGMIIHMQVEAKESQGTFEVIIEVWVGRQERRGDAN